MENGKVIFRVFRYSPESGKSEFKEYEVPTRKGMTVLDGLYYIKENLDGSLVFRASCRMGVCGSCGMKINGKMGLACQTQISHLHSKVITVEPMNNYKIIKDLVPDLRGFFEKHRAVKPYVIRYSDPEEFNDPKGEYLQSPKDVEDYLQFSYCIKCGACVAACPVVSGNEDFLGPQALASAYRYISDSRDEGYIIEREVVSSLVEGAFRCHFAGACSDACPKGVDPALAIQLLKRELSLYSLGLAKKKKKAGYHMIDWNVQPPSDAPKAPPRTV
ncbi:succinate dehydrogenase iron-sulfur subunit [Candidatus Caldipriscus sp.]|nr:succinate dehydrogenase iron-sulfur subunit [Candidatus Caldipriscus sp.]